MPRMPKQLSFEPSAAKPASKEHKPFVPRPDPDFPTFIAQHSTPYNPATDRYDVQAFARDLIIDKAQPPKAIYDMHTYWSKKHWAAIREYIRHYLPEKYYPRGTGLVLDCFSGSGMTGVAATMEDRPCVLVDASPAAAFISYCYTHPVDPEELKDDYESMMTEPYTDDLQKRLQKITGSDIRSLKEELEWLYQTRCDRCGEQATTEYVVYSERYQCPGCAQIVALFDCPELSSPRKGRYCPHCLAKNRGEGHSDFAISTRSEKFGPVPVKVVYKCLGSCRPSRGERQHTDDTRTRKGRFFRECDLRKIEEIAGARIPHWYPDRDFIKGYRYHRDALWNYGVEKLADLYTKRNLWALSAIIERLPRDRLGALLVNMAGSNVSRMRRDRQGGGGAASGIYYMPPISREPEAGSVVRKKFRTYITACQQLRRHSGSVSVCCAAWLRLSPQPESVDYAFTDPPYIHKIQYGELNFVWESWLDFEDSWLKDEIVVNPYRGKSVDDWDRDMRAVVSNCYQALKPGRWLSLCYHDTDPGTWKRIQDMLLDTGFEIHTVTVLDPKQKSSNQLTGEKVVKSDLVLNCRKPRRAEHRTDGQSVDEGPVSERVREIILENLSHAGGQSRDRLWDVVLKRLLTRGQMAEHRFDEILAEVAFKSESGRWFLKEEFENLSQSDIKNEEESGAALERFVRLRSMGVPAQFAAHIALQKPSLARPEADDDEIETFIKEELIDDPVTARKFRLGGRLKGVEFYDCLFFYLTRFLKGRPPGKTPRRNLAEFLEEYLVRFKDADKWLYRPPERSEAESLRKSRQTGLGRRIRQYVAFLRGEGEFPKEKMPDAKTLVAWLKHCSAFGLAAEGVVLYERGGLMAQLYSLSEDQRYDADEYYTNCKRKAGKTRDEEEQEQEEIAGEDSEGNGDEEE